MRIVIAGLIVLALLASGGTYFLVNNYLTTQKQLLNDVIKKVEAAPTVKILVAGTNMPAGMTVARGSLRWVDWPEDSVEKDYVAADEEDQNIEKQFIGSVIRRGIPEGIPLTANMFFKRDAPGFMAGALQPGMRALPISVNDISGAAGFILPGDRVDVILMLNLSKNAPKGKKSAGVTAGIALNYIGETILRNIRVIAIDQQVDDFELATVLAGTVTLEVTSKQAELLTVARKMGSISLSLRSLATETELDKGHSFTSDLEASPFLMSIVKGVAEAERREEEAAAAATAAEKAEAEKILAEKAAARDVIAKETTARKKAEAGMKTAQKKLAEAMQKAEAMKKEAEKKAAEAEKKASMNGAEAEEAAREAAEAGKAAEEAAEAEKVARKAAEAEEVAEVAAAAGWKVKIYRGTREPQEVTGE